MLDIELNALSINSQMRKSRKRL